MRRTLIEFAALGEFLAGADRLASAAARRVARRFLRWAAAAARELEAEVRRVLAHMDEDEPERQVEVLRQFQRAAIFRVAMADLTGAFR